MRKTIKTMFDRQTRIIIGDSVLVKNKTKGFIASYPKLYLFLNDNSSGFPILQQDHLQKKCFDVITENGKFLEDVDNKYIDLYTGRILLTEKVLYNEQV